MFNSKDRQIMHWLALPRPIPSRVIMLLALAALLALPIPAAQAAGCTAFDARPGKPNKNGISKEIGSYYVMVPASNFLTGDRKIYIDDKCDKPAKDWSYPEGTEWFSPGAAFAKNGRKAMEICETNMDKTVAAVSRVSYPMTHFYCLVGERKGGKRQRFEELFGIYFNGDAEGALAECQSIGLEFGRPKHSRPNYVEPEEHFEDEWICYRTWTVSKRYLKRVGA